MLRTYRWLWGAGLLVVAIALAFAVYSCGSSSKSTNPYGGGGGGGTKELDSGNIAATTTFSHTFTTAGSYSYHCNFHANMTGTIVVNSGGSFTDSTLAMVTSQPYPTVYCKTGGTTRWHNGTTATHTVTSN